MNHRLLLGLVAAAAFAACGCSSTTVRVQRTAPPRAQARWVMLPFTNHSETPQAGERIEAMLGTVLMTRGLPIQAHPPPKEDETRLVVGDRQRVHESLLWAKSQRYDYAVTGSVEEWRYKAGIDGEPAVGLTVRIVDLRKDRVVWSASGAKTGGASENTSATALNLLDKLVAELELGR